VRIAIYEFSCRDQLLLDVTEMCAGVPPEQPQESQSCDEEWKEPNAGIVGHKRHNVRRTSITKDQQNPFVYDLSHRIAVAVCTHPSFRNIDNPLPPTFTHSLRPILDNPNITAGEKKATWRRHKHGRFGTQLFPESFQLFPV
jgi:hypothetical protein